MPKAKHESTELASTLGPVAQIAGIWSWAQLPQTEDKPPVCTWSLATTEGRAKLHQVMVGGGLTLWDACEANPIEFAIVDLAAHYAAWESEESPGEIIAGPMLTLVGPVLCYHTGSPNVFEAIRLLMQLEGAPPWNPAVMLKAERVPTRNRRMRMAVTYIGRVQ